MAIIINSMEQIKGTMTHTPQTIQQLSKMQYDTFQMGRKIAQFVCGLILLYIGFMMKSSLVVASICLLFGCLLITGTNMPARHRADRIIKAMNGNFPSTDYIFRKEGFEICTENPELVPYSELIHLGEDENYLYLYISKLSAYMIDKSTITDLGRAKKIIADGSGQKWQGPKSILSYSPLLAFLKQRIRKR